MILIYLFSIIVTVIFCVNFYVRYRRINKLLSKIPSPKGIFLLGNFLEFADPTRNFLKDAKELGGLIRYKILWFPTIVISDYKHVEEILSSSKILNKSREYEFFKRWLGSGLLTAKANKWRKMRKIITPTFHFQILEQYVEVFNSCSNILIQRLKEQVNKPKIDIYNYVTLCALDVICETAMGTKVNAQIHFDSKYVNSVKEMSRVIRERMFSPIKILDLFYFFTSDYRKEKKSLAILHEYTNTVIRNRRELLKKSVDDTSRKKGRLAFLDLLLQSTLDGRPMTDSEIREEVDTFMFEGHDTTASAISNVFYSLSHNPEIQKKVMDELTEIFGKDQIRAATYNELQNMKYLEMVIKETLRLYPSVPFFARKVEEDTEFGNYVIPGDVTLVILAWGLHRNPDLYPEPEKFIPERFSPEEQSRRKAFDYIPFSAGPRNCIGQRFAMLEMKATISKVLRHYEILPVEKFNPVWVPDVIMKPIDGIQVKLKERNI